jgi:DNA polymerase-3 subunit beta
MMKIIAKREAILSPLQAVIGVVERKQTMPILANVLLSAKGGKLSVTATDLEVELVATSEVDVQRGGDITVPGRKLLDICRALADGTMITLELKDEKMTVRAARSRFSLTTLPAAEFPTVDEINAEQTLELTQKDFKRLLDKTYFSMAQQDVRYYLNGLLLETSAKLLRTVATDGHRLALCEIDLPEGGKPGQQVIVPRKGVLELQRILGNEDATISVAIGSNHVRVQIGEIRFTSKLIDGRFPEYSRVIPNQPPRLVGAVREDLRHALQRAAILSNEKYRGIRFGLKPNQLTIQAHNPEQEEAEEEVEVNYDGEEIEIGFNVNYLLEALAAVDGEEVQVGLTDGNSSCLIRSPQDGSARYVVMPMRL